MIRRRGTLCLRLVLAALVTGLVPTTAEAHLVTARFGDFYSGALHPLTALEHVIPWLAVGLLAGLQEIRTGRWMVLVFPVAIFAGTCGSAVWPSMALLSMVNLASFIVLGALVALAWRLPPPVLLGLGAAFGFSHGYENGLAAPPDGKLWLFGVGVTAAGYVIVTLITALTVVITRRRGWPKVAVRAVGSWIGAIGIMLVGLTAFTA